MNNQVLMFFVIFLIVSITPCCAFEINQSTNTHQSLNVIKDDTNKLNLKLAELKVHTDKIEESWNYITDNWYAFWNWGTVSDKFNEIETEAPTIQPLTDEIEVLTKKIKENITIPTPINENETEDTSEKANALDIIKQLKNTTNITLNLSPSTNLTTGDIIQYKSQNKYSDIINSST